MGHRKGNVQQALQASELQASEAVVDIEPARVPEVPIAELEQVREELLVLHAAGVAVVAHVVVGPETVHPLVEHRRVTIPLQVCRVKCSIQVSQSVSQWVAVLVHTC